MYDYATAAGLNLPPDAAKELNRIMYTDPREVMYQLEREARKLANKQFEELRIEIQEKEAERRRLWGSKYPRVLGQKPGDDEKEKINRTERPKTPKVPQTTPKAVKTSPRAGKVARN